MYKRIRIYRNKNKPKYVKTIFELIGGLMGWFNCTPINVVSNYNYYFNICIDIYYYICYILLLYITIHYITILICITKKIIINL